MTSVPNAYILSSKELQRIRNSVNDGPSVSPGALKAQKKSELKKLSDARQKNWPNTLEALRLKKESFLKDKLEREENQRREVDRIEAEIRKQARMDTIKRANDLLYEQTDKMKMLKSQKSYADAVAYRKFQIQEKIDQKSTEKEAAAKYHKYILENVDKLEKIELKKIEERKKLNDQVAIFREEQVNEVMKKRDAEFAENEAIGLAMKKRAEQQLIEAAIAYEEKQKLAAETTANMYAMNAQLKIIKQELRAQEAAEAARRDAEVEVIENRKIARKALEKRRFDRAQEQRQKIIDAAVEAMEKQNNQHQSIQEKQAKELNDKMDRADAEKAANAASDWEFTVNSRTAQMQAKQRQIQADKELEERLAIAWREKMEIAHEKEVEKERKAKETTYQIKALQYEEGVMNRRKKVEDRIIEIEQSRLLREIAGQDDAKFVETCNAEIKKYISEGKPVYTLLRALDYRQPELIPAVLIKKQNEK